MGQILQGRYRLEQILGEGGQGEVYLATELVLNTKVAIKSLNLETSKDPVRVREQFLVEARILARLQHPGLPKVSHFFEEGGGHYVVMDYIQGRTLADMLIANAAPFHEWIVIQVAIQVAKVLDYLHTNDPMVVVRDLKTTNMMLTKDGTVKLIDFGLAKVVENTSSGVTNTIIRGAGTPGFAAPEQYGRRSTDGRTDIYAFGASLYHMLTGAIPPPSIELLQGTEELIPVRRFNPSVSLGMATIVEQMLVPNIERRLQSAAQALEMLERLAKVHGHHSPRLDPSSLAPTPSAPAGETLPELEAVVEDVDRTEAPSFAPVRDGARPPVDDSEFAALVKVQPRTAKRPRLLGNPGHIADMNTDDLST